ncbi:MAG TPA: hypothetical protein PKG54_18110 [Phycisphaerae bacterium]|jgi:hypothetical protein|nr:hypothetical protein [Phycisphaerae bacterium]HOB76429.1 hypothetical protein [Phycisphaerae bacterium]HOJ56905.1 hypothetical protein [Phycisphaerae bacterium]HOL28480.1 hypothetical protein [Phycisphaerae bacterium]HPP22989.1 hypothetical protein [Phycisphaerae bacterium]
MSELERFLSNLQALLDAGEPPSESGPAQDANIRPRPARATEARAGRKDDAIDRELKAPARTSAIVSLRHAPEVEAFRNELTEGLIRVDTANRLLRLANQLISRLLL